MLTAPFEEYLDQAVSHVFESMCFLAADPVDGAMPALGSESQGVQIGRYLEFRGPRKGRFGVRAQLSSAHLFASNLLGEEDSEVDDDHAGECLGEIANMLCGAVLGSLEPDEAFDLTHPCAESAGFVQPLPGVSLVRTYQMEESVLLQAWIEFWSV